MYSLGKLLLRPGRPLLVPALVLSCLASAIAITGESLWIDEANSALKAMQPSLSQWWQALATEKGSDLQMPLYMFYLWGWEKFFGHAEAALRWANVPWYCLGQCALAVGLQHRRRAAWIALTLGTVNPFLWFYLNEARPYLMQYGTASVLCCALYRTAEDVSFGTKPAVLVCSAFALLALCSSSLLGVLWAAFAIVAWWYLIQSRRGQLFRPAALVPLGITGLLAIPLAFYYRWTLAAGAHASGVGRTGPWNALYVAYELLVLAGLGPGRLQLRHSGLTAFVSLREALAPLVAAALFFGGLLAYAARITPQNQYRRIALAGAFYAIPPSLLLFILGYTQNFRILGRHFMPLLPVVLGLFTLAIANLWFRRARLGFLTFTALVCLWIASAFSLRFGQRHRKDDYRDAASIARNALAQGKITWWAADRAAAIYYGLPAGRDDASFFALMNPGSDTLSALPVPQVVFLSRPDTYDAGGAIANYLQSGEFVQEPDLPAFTVWRR